MRISVVGGSGSGKTTLARRLAQRMRIPHLELDAVTWQAGWRALHEDDPAEFIRRVEPLIAQDAWVTDGNYSVVQWRIRARATDVVWLDYPRPVVMARVIRRSFARAISGRELWPGTGNVETFARWLDKEHPIRWSWDTFASRRAKYEAIFADTANAHVRLHRLRHPREAAGLLERLARENPGGVEAES